ncbi:MAG: hypothetical protein H0X51_08945 [Parachlamydiaceae bacterium]|nr:hypothetical protein [Parachlamydiaceae bacterium]
MTSEIRTDMIRQLTDLALRYGRKQQSAQTRFVHYFHHANEGEAHETIPLVENALFALALFHNRTSESVVEGKEVIDRLLHFQNTEGNFPLYLHEYPQGRDRFIGAHLLPPLYWILKSFHTVLGSELRQRLEAAVSRLLVYVLNMHAEHPAPYYLAIRIAASAKAFGDFFKDSFLQEQGTTLLEKLQQQNAFDVWCSPGHIADLLVALQMIYPNLSNSPWQHFWKHLQKTWHSPTMSYAGPALREYQCGAALQTTLYDLFMGYYGGTLSPRALQESPVHLHAALIRPSTDQLTANTLPYQSQGEVRGLRWVMQQTPTHAWNVIERQGIVNPATENGVHLLRMTWGLANTFVCQGGTSKVVSHHVHAEGIDLVFEFSDAAPSEEREKDREIAFYFNTQPNVRFLVNSIPATTFKLNEPVQVHADGLALQISCTLESGEGTFLGHFMRGNRPSQLALKGEKRFQAYDWQVILRTLRRDEQCRIKVALRFLNV